MRWMWETDAEYDSRVAAFLSGSCFECGRAIDVSVRTCGWCIECCKHPDWYIHHMDFPVDGSPPKPPGMVIAFAPNAMPCPARLGGCHDVFLKSEELDKHVLGRHPMLLEAWKESTWAERISSIVDGPARCPFCLLGSNVRAMVFETPEGLISPKRKCKGCAKEMDEEGPLVAIRGAAAYAKWITETQGFWQTIDFAAWSKALDALHLSKTINKFDFWREYRKLKPKNGEWTPKQTPPIAKEEEKQEIKPDSNSYRGLLDQLSLS